MQRDFHYYCVAFLARAAGFSKGDALTLAYASQYVDNATESEPLRVGKMIFDPVRTAHIGLESYNWGVQKRIYIPFHFLPPKPIQSHRDSFIVSPDPAFAHLLIDEAKKENNKQLRLCRVGIALHAYADSWSHQGFSGRDNRENDVEKIRHYKNGTPKRLILENIFLDFLPEIGHAEAGCFPDFSYLKWDYINASREKVVRDNTGDFHKAAKKIYDILCGLPEATNPPRQPWRIISDDIRTLLEDTTENIDDRCDNWIDFLRNHFKKTKTEYDKHKWRRAALVPRKKSDIDWDKFKRKSFEKLTFAMKPGFYNSLWVKFHRAALLQRHFVLERLL